MCNRVQHGEIRTGSREAVVDLGGEIERFLRSVGAEEGLLNVWVPHATAGLAVIETGAGSDTDLLAALRDLLPADGRWRHRHGSRPRARPRAAGAHRAFAVGSGARTGRLALGTWQSVCLVDTNRDNPVRRSGCRSWRGERPRGCADVDLERGSTPREAARAV